MPDSVDYHGAIDGYLESHNWTKRNIFWELPYWKHLLIRHNLDVMHFEKNVFHQVINTIMDVKGKTKDDVNARRDLAARCKRKKLHIQTSEHDDGGRTEIVLNAPYVIGKNKVKALCEWLKELKLPGGYVSNLSLCVYGKNGKLHNLKCHNCHVFMKRLLPIAVRELLPPNIWKVLTKLSQFFRDLSAANMQMDDVL